MSTAADVLRELKQFLTSLDRLLASHTLQAIVELIEGLGGGRRIHDVASELAGVLRALERHLVQLTAAVADPLRHVQAMGGLLGLLGPLLDGMEQLLATSAEQLAEAGLDQAIQISQPVRDSVDFAGRVVDAGARLLQMLPDPEHLHALQERLAHLIQVVDSYVQAAGNSSEFDQEDDE